jgi:lipoprotein-releasing system permease protein
VFGVAFGLGLVYSFSTFALDSAGDPIVNVVLDVPFLLVSVTIAILASVASALIPAKRSSELTIIEVIRNG